MKDLPKAYEAKDVEDGIYSQWEESGFFNPDNLPGDRDDSFTISMPPPNATGQLHLGHAVMLAIEDIFVRTARMQGKAALWVPGTDHAPIATEAVVIKNLVKGGMEDPRAELGRDKLLGEIEKYVEESRSTINTQVRKMGSSCDWSRERYTFEPALNRIVNDMFIRMHEDGLIYRGNRIVNWDPLMQTTVSDDEVEYEDRVDPFYYLQYGPFVIATSRPETKFGDKYVVMHPDDDRYKDYEHGQQFECEWVNGTITATVIKDEAIDMELGSGVMTITPWHDAADFEIAERHNLDREPVIDFDGNMLAIAGEFEGLPIAEARTKIIEKLDAKGLVVKIDENYQHSVARSYRGGLIEPQIKEQWWIDVNKQVVDWKDKKMSLKEVMQDVVRSKDIEIIPERFEKIYFNWIDNLHDWCISRQIWFGHRVPVWYRQANSKLETRNSKNKEEMHIGATPPEGDGWEQDPDTLDTWFSSALWTWSTLIKPQEVLETDKSLDELISSSEDIKRFHPTSVLETGYDILFFWVARMILMTTYATGEIPFEKVYLHGMVTDRDGKKMSKSKPETNIDPLDMIEQFGTDALRLSMIVGQTPGNNSRLYKEKIAGYRNFVNKLWNISRFILTSVDLESVEAGLAPAPQTLADRWILSRFEEVRKDVTRHIEGSNLSLAIESLYSFTWNELADWYLEIAKLQLKDDTQRKSTSELLLHLLRDLLTLWHPFTPFVTEHIYSLLPEGLRDTEMMIVRDWPAENTSVSSQDVENFERVQQLITRIRTIRADHSVPPKDKVSVSISNDALITENSALIEHLARVNLSQSLDNTTLTVHEAGFDISLDIPENEAAAERAKKERANLEKYIAAQEKKLANDKFVSGAPAEVVEAEREKLTEAQAKLAKLS